MLDEGARAELLATFQVESGEHRQALSRAFLTLEKEPEAAERDSLIDDAFRSAHSLKGAARAVGLGAVEALAHGLEGVLGAAKHGEIGLSPRLFDLLYAAVDALGEDEGGGPSLTQEQVDTLARQLEAAQAGQLAEPAASGGQALATSPPPSVPQASRSASLPPSHPAASAEPGRPASTTPSVSARRTVSGGGDTIRLPAARLDVLLEQLGELILPHLESSEALAELAALRRDLEAWQREWRKTRPVLGKLERNGMLAHHRPVVRFLEQNEMHLAGFGSALGALHARLAGSTMQLGTLTDHLQTDVKRFRMLPFGSLTERLERAVRDLARSLGKEARLVVIGADTELDRGMIEDLKDPLLHLVRNALDHGIEAPAERQRLGKPSIGGLVVAASQRGGSVVIEVEDDGGGIDADAVRRAANEAGLVPEPQLTAMSDAEALRLLFLPGLSTRSDVSAVSGRGVGLDVVARNVERLGGQVDLQATRGHGARFILTLPLTLASMRAVLIEVDGGLYALPVAAVQRILRVEEFRTVGGRRMLEHEGAVVPVAVLADLLGAEANQLPSGPGARTIVALIAVGSQRLALVIDRVVGEQEIVVRPLSYPLQRVRHIAAATILGSGRVVPILHMGDIVRAGAKLPGGVPAPQRMQQEHRPLRVLVADDSLTTRTMERFILEAAGYDVELAGDGAEALAVLQERGCDVLVSDVNMPTLDGVGLTARVRQDPRFRDLPVILVTSLDSAEDRERGLLAGADAYIVKGTFDQDHLLRTIRELV